MEKIALKSSLWKKVLIIAGVVAMIGLVVFLFVWGGNISSIEVTNVPTEEPYLQQKAQECLQTFNGRSFWFLADKDVRAAITKCDPMFVGATIRNSFPGKMIVTIDALQPIAKIDKNDDGCILARDSNHVVTLSKDRCSFYSLPLLVGSAFEKNNFSLEFGTSLLRELSSYGLVANKVEYKGDQVATWYQVELRGPVTVLIPSGTDLKAKITTLNAAINGLNAAKERYSMIDLRFDRVVYK